MAKIDKKYHKLLNKIISNGFRYEDPNRKGVYRLQIPSCQIKHNLQQSFPAITTKKLYWKGIVGELIWFLRGDTNIKYLIDNNINIWNKDAYNYYLKLVNNKHKIYSYDKWLDLIKNRNIQNLGFEGVGSSYAEGPLGRIYGAQWRRFRNKKSTFGNTELYGVDQISNLITGLKLSPMGTKHIVTAWNPAELNDMALPPCHWSFEILVEPLSVKEQGKLHPEMWDMFLKAKLGDQWEEKVNKLGLPRYKFTLKWHQRSVDVFLGKM